MPISCHFWDCKALLVTSPTHVCSATASARPLPLIKWQNYVDIAVSMMLSTDTSVVIAAAAGVLLEAMSVVMQGYALCPYCYSHPPFREMKKGMGCNECTHPSCPNSLAMTGVSGCVECDSGTLVLDLMSAPKWRIVCNRSAKCFIVNTSKLAVSATGSSWWNSATTSSSISQYKTEFVSFHYKTDRVQKLSCTSQHYTEYCYSYSSFSCATLPSYILLLQNRNCYTDTTFCHHYCQHY